MPLSKQPHIQDDADSAGGVAVFKDPAPEPELTLSPAVINALRDLNWGHENADCGSVSPLQPTSH